MAKDSESQPPAALNETESAPASTEGKVSPLLVYEIETPLGLGRYAPFQYERSVQLTRVRLFWRRITVWLAGLMLAAWVLAATGLYFFVKYGRGFSEVHYSHMLLLPWKIDDYRRTKGEAWVKEGLTAAEAGEWRQAFQLLRGGLPAVPEAREARLMLSRIFIMAGRNDLARETLLEGLKYHLDELAYLRIVLGFLFDQQADAAVIEVTTGLAGRVDPNSPEGRMVATAKAFALFNRDEYAEAEAGFRSAGLTQTPEGRFVAARSAWEQGRREEALTRLRALHAQEETDEEIYRTLFFYLRESGQVQEARRLAFARQLQVPDRVEPRLDFITASLAAGEETEAAAAEEECLRIFANDTTALLRLADLAAKGGRAGTAWRVEARCRELGKEEAASALIAVQAELERRNYPEALRGIYRFSDEVLNERRAGGGKWSEVHRQSLAGLQAVAYYATGKAIEAEPLLVQMVAARVLNAPTLTLLASHLERVGPRTQVEQVLKAAVERDPLFQPALAALLRTVVVEDDLSPAGPWIERYTGMRKPSAELLDKLALALSSDRYVLMPERERLMGLLSVKKRVPGR